MNARVLVASLIATAALAGCGKSTARQGAAPAPSASNEIRPATAEQLQAAIRAPGAKVVLVNVWATWCVPCRQEFPDLMRIEREYRDRGLRLMLVSADGDDGVPAARAFLHEQGVGFLTYLKQGSDMPFINALDSRWSGALPASFLYDSVGNQTWFHEGKTSYDSLKVRVEQTIAQAGTTRNGGG
jgi:thiol-disulfide isomerase/thioredoxin